MILEKKIKKLIKKRGFKLSNFSENYLKLSYQTFNHQLKNDNLKINILIKLLQVLNITFEELITGSLIDSDLMNSNTVLNKHLESSESNKAKPSGGAKVIINKNKYKGLKGLI